MSEAERLTKIKLRLDLNGNDYHNNTISEYITDVMTDLESIGVATSVVESEESLGVIAQGVKDLWTNVAGATKYSDYFYERADRLRRKVIEDE